MQDTKIRNDERFRQKVKFDKIRGCQATDIDYFCDVKGKAFIFAEFKVEGKAISLGQRIAAERLVQSNTIPTYFFFLSHTTSADEDIIAGDAIVECYWAKDHNKNVACVTPKKREAFKDVKKRLEKRIRDS